ncbi:MAG: alanine racemase [Alphaproteobacteria bacterium]|nr:alanine racemase [Alphaproteobacteria bacterium]
MTRPTLSIDLLAIVENYRRIAQRVKPAEAAAVVKADGYGLGAKPVALALAAAGCRTFFVAHTEEGAELRPAIPDAKLYILHGYTAAQKQLFAEHKLSPVLSSVGQLSDWLKSGLRVAYALHLDTGMSRLGLSEPDLKTVEGAASPALVMSHLASSDDPEHEKNQSQLARFKAMAKRFPGTPLSLAASGGCFLGPSYTFDLVRPGIALYGGNPGKSAENPMKGTVTLSAPLLQVRSIDRGDTVGYGATYAASGPRRLGIAAFGYADGLMRSLSNRGHGVIAGVKCPIVGRVSMDLVTLDVTQVPERAAHAGAEVEFIGPNQTVDELAHTAGTLPYEIYTRLGPRIARTYTGAR